MIQLVVTSKLLIHLLLLLYDEVSYSSVFYSFFFNGLLMIYIFVDHFLEVVYLMVTWYAPTTYIFVFGSLSWISWMLSNLCNIQFRFKCIFPPKFQITIWNFPNMQISILSFFIRFHFFFNLNFFVTNIELFRKPIQKFQNSFQRL